MCIKNILTKEEVKSHLTLETVIEQALGAPKTKSGNWLKWCCPFHDDHNPSFAVDIANQTWKCFGGCDVPGNDVFAFWQKYENIQFIDALRKGRELVGDKE